MEINHQSGLLYYSLYRDFLPVLEGKYHIVIISGMEAQLATDRRRLRPVRAEEKVA